MPVSGDLGGSLSKKVMKPGSVFWSVSVKCMNGGYQKIHVVLPVA